MAKSAPSKSASTPPAAPAQKVVRKKSSKSHYTLVLIVVLTSMIVFKETTFLVLIGMMPSIVSFIVDSRPQKYTSLSIMILNMCGVLNFVFELWDRGASMSNAISMMVDPITLLVMWGSAFLGWLLTQVTPPFVGMVLDVTREENIRRLKRRQKALLNEWGEQVALEASQMINLDEEEDRRNASEND